MLNMHCFAKFHCSDTAWTCSGLSARHSSLQGDHGGHRERSKGREQGVQGVCHGCTSFQAGLIQLAGSVLVGLP